MLHLIDPDEPIIVKDSEIPGVRDGDPETTYTLRPIASDDHRRLTKQHTKKGIDPVSRATVEEIDFEALNDATLDFVLVGWSGILIKGEPAPCVLANKKRLDGVRQRALQNLAGMNQIARLEEVRAESFREPSDVRAVLGG